MKKNDKLFLTVAAVLAVIIGCFAFVKGCKTISQNIATCYDMRDHKMSLVRRVREGLYKDGDHVCVKKDTYTVELFPYGCVDKNNEGIYDYMIKDDRLIKVTWYNRDRTEVKRTEYFSVYSTY